MDKAYVTVMRLEASNAPYRKFNISIDGQHAGKIGHNETLALIVEPGTHTIRARIDWDRSEKIEFTLAAGENAFFVCDWQKRIMNPNMRLEQVDEFSV